MRTGVWVHSSHQCVVCVYVPSVQSIVQVLTPYGQSVHIVIGHQCSVYMCPCAINAVCVCVCVCVSSVQSQCIVQFSTPYWSVCAHVVTFLLLSRGPRIWSGSLAHPWFC